MIVFGAIIDGVATRKDKTLTVRIGTQELSGETAGELFGLQNALVFVAIKVEDFGKEEIEALERLKADAMADSRKTESQRLRAVLYKLWQQNPEGYKDSNSHYIAKMEAIIEHLKKKLNP